MRTTHAGWLWTIALLLTVIAPGTVFACSCGLEVGGDPPCTQFDRAGAVFAGRVLGVEEIWVPNPYDADSEALYPQRRFLLEVLEAFAGVDGGEVEVVTGMGGGDCGYDFTVGRDYFVYAYYSSSDGQLHAGICGRTRPLGRAEEDLAYARRVVRGERPTSIFGAAIHVRRNARTGDVDFSPIRGATIYVEGPRGDVWTARTSKRGEFRVEVPESGSYRVRGEWPDQWPPAPTMEVVVAAGTCVRATLRADDPEADGRPPSDVGTHGGAPVR